MTLRPCGTEAAYYRHRSRGEQPCSDCCNGLAETRLQRGVTRRRFKPAEHGTTSKYTKGCRCRPCKDAQAEYMRRLRGYKRRQPRTKMWEVILDILELNMTSMSFASIQSWVIEVHPEWNALSVRQIIHRLEMDGRVVRVEFGDEIRYRLP